MVKISLSPKATPTTPGTAIETLALQPGLASADVAAVGDAHTPEKKIDADSSG